MSALNRAAIQAADDLVRLLPDWTSAWKASDHIRRLVADNEASRKAMQQAVEALESMTRHFCISRLGESRLADSQVRGAAHAAVASLRERVEAQP